MIMRHRTSILGGLVLLVTVALGACAPEVPPNPPADPVIDQQSTVSPLNAYLFTGTGTNSLGGGSNLVTGQVVTAGITGTMTKVSLSFQQDTALPNPAATLDVRVEAAAANGLPTGPVLATATYSGVGSVDRALIDLSLSAPVPVVAGQRVAILVSSATTVWQVNETAIVAGAGTYGGGDVFVVNSTSPSGTSIPYLDLYFRTWVVPA